MTSGALAIYLSATAYSKAASPSLSSHRDEAAERHRVTVRKRLPSADTPAGCWPAGKLERRSGR